MKKTNNDGRKLWPRNTYSSQERTEGKSFWEEGIEGKSNAVGRVAIGRARHKLIFYIGATSWLLPVKIDSRVALYQR